VFEDNACRPYRRHARRVIRGNAAYRPQHIPNNATICNCVLKFKFNPVGRVKKNKTKRNGDFFMATARF